MYGLTPAVLDTEDPTTAPALDVRGYLADRNGWATPLATADAVADYARRAQRNDPNGSYGTVTVDASDVLTWTLGDGDPMTWNPGVLERGTPVYALDGLCWHRLSDAVDVTR